METLIDFISTCLIVMVSIVLACALGVLMYAIITGVVGMVKDAREERRDRCSCCKCTDLYWVELMYDVNQLSKAITKYRLPPAQSDDPKEPDSNEDNTDSNPKTPA